MAAIDLATARIETFPDRYSRHWLDGMRRKLGLFTAQGDDAGLAQSFLDVLQEGEIDFTLAFRSLAEHATEHQHSGPPFETVPASRQWLARWRERLALEQQTPAQRAELMRGANPCFIPRNHRVEEALTAAIELDDLSPFKTLLEVLRRPFDDQPEYLSYTDPPGPEGRFYRTFCGT